MPGARAAARAAADAESAAHEAGRRARQRAAAFDAAGAPRDVLADFAPFARFDRAGLDAELFFAAPGGAGWSPALADAALDLTRANMRAQYDAAGADWRWDDAAKRGEALDAEARYVVARERGGAGALLGFVCFRFVLEEAADALYVYELQLAAGAQRRGLGKHLMQVCELVARKQGMHWCAAGARALSGGARAKSAHPAVSPPPRPRSVMLTVFRDNAAALDFYTRKMKYVVDESSPSACGDDDAKYEILSKVVNAEAARAARARAALLA